jgi:carbon storage regulator
MLRITRRAGERVIVGGEVVIEVLEVRGGTVRLGIDAPRSVSIYREEIWLEVKRENEAAASAPDDLPTLPALADPGPGGSLAVGRTPRSGGDVTGSW